MKLLGKIPENAKGISMIALIYFLYSVFDSRYALKAEVSTLALDVAVAKTTISQVKEDTNEIKTDLKKFLEERHDN